jgi:hypothetical protein
MGPGERFVTIVSGLPRSGTSMMMHMLEAGGMTVITDNQRTADVDNPQGYFEFEPAKKTKDDPSWLDGAEGKVVKMVYKLLYDLPDRFQYRVLVMRRAMPEVLASQRKMLERLGKPTDTVADEKIGALLARQLREFDEWVRKQSNFTVLDVDYNQMVADPAPLIEKVNTFLGGGLDTVAMRSVVEPELYRNRS